MLPAVDSDTTCSGKVQKPSSTVGGAVSSATNPPGRRIGWRDPPDDGLQRVKIGEAIVGRGRPGRQGGQQDQQRQNRFHNIAR